MSRTSKGIFLLLLALCFLAPVEAGSIVGTIRAEPPAPQPEGKKGSAGYESRRYRFLNKIDYASLKDFVVSLEGGDYKRQESSEISQESVSQQNGSFVPRVLPVVVGTEVAWPNRDEIFHNVFSMSDVRQFDLGYYKKEDDPKRIVFEKEGKVDVFCSIHEEMNCVVLVFPNPWFSKSDKRGRYEIRDIPAGKYRLKAWHERMPSKYIDIEVSDGETLELDIVIGLSDLPKI